VCDAVCDEACGQVAKITYECRGAECQAEHPQLIYMVHTHHLLRVSLHHHQSDLTYARTARRQARLLYPVFRVKMPAFANPEAEARFLSVNAVKDVYMVNAACECTGPWAT
jgi:hypothetical protein